MAVFVKQTDKNGNTYIIEGEVKDKNVFSIKRFICEIQHQDTQHETIEVADMILEALNEIYNK